MNALSVNALSLRTKFLLIVLIGAMLPLAVVGWWLTGTAVRSGRALLHGQLDAAVTGIAADAQEKWTLRSGELQLLANNTLVRSALAVPATRLAEGDSAYLTQLFGAFHTAIPFISYVDAAGRERWSFHEADRVAAPVVARDQLARAPIDSTRDSREVAMQALTFPVEIPVQSESGRVVGTLRARVRLSSVLVPDSGQHVVPGAVFAAFDARGVLASNAPESLDVTTPALHPSWEIVTRQLDAAPLRVILAAPVAPFVQPFESAARIGLGVLMGVAVVALIVSAMLTGRVTGSLERMVVAAEAVAAGNLHGKVDVSSGDETGRLADAFNKMTESLRQTIAELSQQRALAAVGEFAASLSHEVRNSLTAMRIDLQHATRQLPEDSTVTPLVKRTLETVRRLDCTVTGALRVARSGQTTMSRIDLAVLLRRAMASAEPSFAASEATLEPLALGMSARVEADLDVHAPADVHVDGDAVALEQLFLNLLLNAAQARSAGGRAQADVRSEGQNIVVRISDNGPGIHAGVLTDDGALMRSTKPGGTGLGLPIARRIAAAHGGDLRIESAAGVGTTVVVTLPTRHVNPGETTAL